MSRGGIHSSRLTEHKAYKEGLRARIRAILQEQWDPIRVYTHRERWVQQVSPELPDCEHYRWPDGEYDCYMDTLEYMLDAGFSWHEVVKMLTYWAKEPMLSPIPPAQDGMTADALLAIPLQKEWDAPGWRSRTVGRL